MNRRGFLKVGAALGSYTMLSVRPLTLFSAAGDERTAGRKAYRPGEAISPEAFVLDQKMEHHKLRELCAAGDDVMVNVLYIFGGGAMGRENKLGGIWCKDSFEDLQIMRFIHTKYEEMPVQIIPVACAPVYSTRFYGFEARVFLDEPDDSEKFQAAAKAFIDSTQASFEAGFIPVRPYFDVRNRLMLNARADLRPGAGYGKIYDWQGRFRADDETQKYGVPSIWMLDAKGVVLDGPFHGNYYHSDPYEIKYTLVDIDKAIEKRL